MLKLLSEDAGGLDDAPLEGIRRILEEETGLPRPKAGFDAPEIAWVRMGTTLATNALLERKGARCALVVTRGFGDILRIGNQDRPALFDLEIRKPDLLYETVIEVDERLRVLAPDEEAPEDRVVRGVTGERFLVLQAPDPDALRPAWRRSGTGAFVPWPWFSCMPTPGPIMSGRWGGWPGNWDSPRFPLSSEVMPRVKIVARGDTAMVDAYLSPRIQAYIDGFNRGFRERPARFPTVVHAVRRRLGPGRPFPGKPRHSFRTGRGRGGGRPDRRGGPRRDGR